MVLSQKITDEQVLTATTADVLAGTTLDNPAVPGVYVIFASSDQNDTTITVRIGGRTVVSNAIVVQDSAYKIRENEDPHYTMVSRTGARPVVTVTETTAMNCRVRTHFIPAFRT